MHPPQLLALLATLPPSFAAMQRAVIALGYAGTGRLHPLMPVLPPSCCFGSQKLAGAAGVEIALVVHPAGAGNLWPVVIMNLLVGLGDCGP